MSHKKDMRRDDLVVPYIQPPKDKPDAELAGTLSSTLPMVAIISRNKMLGWTAVLFSLQTWLGETPAQKANATTPGYFSVGMAIMSLSVCYLPLFLPPTGNRAGLGGTGTEAPAPVPPS